MIRNNQNRRRRGGNNGPRPQQMTGGNNYGNRLDNRQRGNASQLLEKYRALARDAQQAGDRVTAEYYLQYADHYYRVLGDYRDKQPEQNRQRGRDFYEDDSAGFAASDSDGDNDGDEGDDDRGDARSDDRDEPRRDDQRRDEPRTDQRGDNRNDQRGEQRNEQRGNWRDDRPNRDRPVRDGNRDHAQRETGQRDAGQRDQAPREQAQREPRREVEGSRERQPYAANRNSGGDAPRGERRERTERRPEGQRAGLDAVPAGDGPIPGLPGPATLRAPRVETQADSTEQVDPPIRAPRQERVRRELPVTEAVPVNSTPFELAAEGDAAEAAVPRRRGRPRKVTADLPTEG